MPSLTKIPDQMKDSQTIFDNTSPLPDLDVLPRPQIRKKTDRFFLIIFGASIVLMLPFLIYTLCYSDINRLKAYDKCGNICGQKNIKYYQWNCTGQDMTLKPGYSYLKGCVEKEIYDPYSIGSGQVLFDSMHRAIWKVILVSFVPLALCLILLFLFRYAPTVAVWTILAGFWLFFTIVGISIIYSSVIPRILPITMYCILSILMFFGIIFIYRYYIELAAPLLKEATRPLFEIKMMSVVPIGALSGLTVITLIYTVINFHIATSGKLTEVYPGQLKYIGNNLISATMICNRVIFIWAILLVIGAQYITVSAAVARWFTVKDQNTQNDLVPSNLRTTIKYHLGTVALGSVMMTIMLVPRLILQLLAMFSVLKQNADSCLKCLDGFFTHNSYIITGMYGTSYFSSGKKASNLLKRSIGDTRDLNNFTNSIIQLAQNLVVIVSAVAAFKTLRYEYIYSITFAYIELIIACVCVYTILGTLKVSTNTLFLCATEELLRDKETDLPFTMTMKEVLKGSNKLLLQKVQSKPLSNIPQRAYLKLFLFVFVTISCILFFVAYFT